MQFSNIIAQEANKKSLEIMLHFPMEANLNDANEEKKPGPGAIFSGMSESDIKEILEKNLAGVNYVKGINNHMGSKITEDKRIMTILLKFLKEKNIYFIDSLVTNKSVARKVGKEIGMRIGARDIFLDNEDDPIYIKNQIIKLVNTALKNNKAIGIGHVEKKHTQEVILEMLPYIKSKGIDIVPASKILE